jgi:predicted lipoprotein with Yx(FWY)xxD motif
MSDFFNRGEPVRVLLREQAARSWLEGIVVAQKRKLMVGAAIAASFALTAGCAPAGYRAADYGGGAQPAANDVAPSASTPPADAAADAPAKLPADKTTDKLTGTEVPKMGEVIEDEGGWVLYRFDKDTAKPASKSACAGTCAKVWPPALTNDGKPTIKGVSSKLVGTVARADGTRQLTVAGWPLYRYIGDKTPGKWRGQNVAGTWFVIKPDGTKNLTCVPPKSKAVAPPADESGSEGGGSGTDTGGSDYSY